MILPQSEDKLATKQDLAQAKLDIINGVVGLFITLALMIIGLYLKIG